MRRARARAGAEASGGTSHPDDRGAASGRPAAVAPRRPRARRIHVARTPPATAGGAVLRLHRRQSRRSGRRSAPGCQSGPPAKRRSKRVRKVSSSWIEASEHQMNHSQVDPRLARLFGPLVILAHPTVSPQPGERPLHDPPPLEHFELLLLLLRLIRVPYDQLQDPAAEFFGPLGDAPVVDPVGQDLLQPGKPPDQLLQDRLGTVAILDVGRMDHGGHDQAERVDHDMPLAAVNLLVRILAMRSPLLGGLDALAVDDPHAGARLPAGAAADPVAQGVVDLGPGAVVAPLVEVVVASAPWGEVMRHHPPGAAAAEDVEDAVEDLAEIDRARPTPWLGGREEALEAFPLGPGQIGRVGFGFHVEL